MSAEDEEDIDLQNDTTEEVEETIDTPAEEVPTPQHSEYEIKQFERAKKAEAEVKRLKAELDAKAAIKQPNTDYLSRDEGILIAQGMDADDLEELKAVAKAKDLPLLKAKDTPLFQGYLEHKEAEAKKEKAKLSASKGSVVTLERSISDLSREEHQALVKDMMEKVK